MFLSLQKACVSRKLISNNKFAGKHIEEDVSARSRRQGNRPIKPECYVSCLAPIKHWSSHTNMRRISFFSPRWVLGRLAWISSWFAGSNKTHPLLKTITGVSLGLVLEVTGHQLESRGHLAIDHQICVAIFRRGSIVVRKISDGESCS
jgi:hypothetical protein